MSFYKDHYQVVIMGGGLATDFVRDEFEIEATLHEMMSIGDENDKLKVGAFFDEMGWFHPCASWPLSDLKIKIPIL